MKSCFKYASLLLLACITLTVQAQKIKLREGDLSVLKDETSISVEFTYDNMSVGKFPTEAEYIEKKKAEYNAKEPGKGDEWAKNWVADRQALFQPKFIELFEESSGMNVKKGATYTLIFHTTTTEPGFNVGVMRKNAEIDAEITIVETANSRHVVAVVTVTNAPGRTVGGFDFATGERLAECYAVAGKKFGKFLKK